jgi:hypothetical protein
MQSIRERFTFNQLHNEKTRTIGFFETINVRDIGMVERRQHSSFSIQAGQTV